LAHVSGSLVQICCFGTEKQAQRLRLTGVVGRAYRQADTPKLPKAATEHFLRVLRSHDDEKAHQIVNAPKTSFSTRPGATALTSEQKTRLLWRYMPDEAEAENELRKKSHKWLWRYMQRRDWKRFDVCLEQMQDRQLRFDEVTYNMAIYGVLLHPRRDDEVARRILSDMVEEKRYHPTLLRLHTGFIESYFELKEVEAAPNPWDLLKVAKTFWQVSVNFKRERVKTVRRKLAEAAMEQLPDSQGVIAGAEEYEEELAGLLDDGQHKPGGVRFPAKRPQQLKAVHKGSGVPNRRRHRWKH